MEKKYVRILKDGQYDGVEYKKDEIWEYLLDWAPGDTIKATKDNLTTIVCVNPNNSAYGQEAEFIGAPSEIHYQIY